MLHGNEGLECWNESSEGQRENHVWCCHLSEIKTDADPDQKTINKNLGRLGLFCWDLRKKVC